MIKQKAGWTMNLVTEEWVPVITMDGKPDFASLMQVFTEGEKFADLSVRPHERVALMRLFICIAQAALDGPKNKDDWKTAPDKLPDAARKYLENLKIPFDLFDKKNPFLQIVGLKSKELTPISKLDLFLATGNNTTLFDHEANGVENRLIESRKIPLMLLTYQCFSPGGGLPITSWGKIKTGQVGNPDTLCITGGMYHTFLREYNLLKTICLNLLPKTTVRQHYGAINNDGYWGRPVWENWPKKSDDKKGIQNATQTYLGRLVPICRWVKIEPDLSGMHCGKGFDYPVMDRKVRKQKKNLPNLPIWPAEPTAAVVLNKDKTERFVLGAKPDKAIWRELAALLIHRNKNSVGGPLVFQNDLPDEFDVHVCALIRNQATIESMVESVCSVSVKLLNEGGRGIYEWGVEQSEWRARSLGYAIEIYRRNIDRFWDQRVEQAGKDRNKIKAKLHSMAMRTYWTAIEKQRHLLMSCVEAFGTDALEPARQVWGKTLHKAARETYKVACGQETPRQIRAFALGCKKLFLEKKVAEEENEEQNIDGGEE